MHTNQSGQKKRGARSWAGQLGAPSSALLGLIAVVVIGTLLAINLPTQVVPTASAAPSALSTVQLSEEDVQLPQTVKVAAANRSGCTDLWE